MFLIVVDRKRRKRAAQVVKYEVSAEAQPPLQDAISTRVVGKVLETLAIEIVEAVKTQVKQMRGVGVGVRRTIVRRHHLHLGARLGNTIDLGHHSQDIRLVLKKV